MSNIIENNWSKSDSELITALLGKYIPFTELLNLTEERAKNYGLTPSKARTAMTVGELIRRGTSSVKLEDEMSYCIHDSVDAVRYSDKFFPLRHLDHEQFYVMYLNRHNKVKKHLQHSIGGINGTVADVRLILHHALVGKWQNLIVFHNHPSGNSQPSESDIQLTKKIKESAKIMNINLIDHIIISNQGFYSFASEGTL